MAINPLIPLQANADLSQGINALTQGVRERPLHQARKAAAKQQKMQAFSDIEKQKLANSALLSQQIMPDIQSGNIDAVRNRLTKYVEHADELGVDPGIAAEGLELLESNPQQLAQLADRSIKLASQFQPVSEELGKIRKEARGRISGRTEELTKAASEIESNFNKIGGLVGEMQKGNRQAVAQGLIALVKLGEPNSTVREGEMLAALNAENPIAAMTRAFEKGGAGRVGQSILRQIDPLNPETISADNVLSTAEALVSASVPQIQRDFQIQQELAQENLTPEGFKSIFSDRMGEVVSGLSNLKFDRQRGGRQGRQHQGGGQQGGQPRRRASDVQNLSDDELLNF